MPSQAVPGHPRLPGRPGLGAIPELATRFQSQLWMFHDRARDAGPSLLTRQPPWAGQRPAAGALTRKLARRGSLEEDHAGPMPGPCDRLTGSALHAGHCRRLVDQAEPGEHATFEARSSSRAWQCGEVWYGAKRDHRRVSGLAPTGPQTRCCLRSTMAPANCTCAACVQTPLNGPACQTAARQLTCDSNSADSAKSSLKALGRRCPHTQAGRQAAVPYRLPWHSWQCSRLVFVSTQRAGGPHPPPTNCKPPRLGMLFFRQISTSKKSLREHGHVM